MYIRINTDAKQHGNGKTLIINFTHTLTFTGYLCILLQQGSGLL